MSLNIYDPNAKKLVQYAGNEEAKAVKLEDLPNVDTNNLSGGDILKYDNDNEEWVNSSNKLGNINDVNLTNLQNGDRIKYDAQTNSWINGPGAKSDWANDNPTDDSYIANKPTLGSAATSNKTNAATQGSNDVLTSGGAYTLLQGKANTATSLSGYGISDAYTKTEIEELFAEHENNAFSNVKVGDTTVAADGKTDTLELVGSNVTLTPDATNDKVTIGITKGNVTSALGYTPPTSDTNTHRPIQVDGTEILGDNVTALNLKAGSNVSMSNSSGTVTIASTDTNNAVTQSSTTASNWRKVALGYQQESSPGTAVTTVTNQVYVTPNIEVQPVSGRIRFKGHNELITGSGTAGSDKGSGVSPRYFPAKWTFNIGTAPSNGDTITIKIPVAGHSYGVYVSINNGTNYHPVVLNGTARLTTHYPVNTYITLVYESSGSAASIYPVAGGDEKTTVTGGAWRVVNYYDSNTTYSVVSTSANGLAPKVTDTSKFLKGNGTWAAPSKSDVGLSNVGNFKAVSTVASQGLTEAEKSNARANIDAGTSFLALSGTGTNTRPTVSHDVFESKTWTGLTSFNGSYIWSDGKDINYSKGTTQYVLNKSTSTWSTKIWIGLTNGFTGDYIWTDGTNIYYSTGSTQYVLDNEDPIVWSTKTWTGLTSFNGNEIWTDGKNIYYSNGSTQYVLNKSTSTWSTKTWTGLTNFHGYNVWTDGINIYYSSNSTQYVLNESNSTWSTKTWTGLTNFQGLYIWTDGTNIYYSNIADQYVLNKETSTWSTKTWTGLTNSQGFYMWSDGTNIYFSNSGAQYVLKSKRVR